MDVDTDETLTMSDVENLKVTELKKALRDRGLADKGLKSALQGRLKAFLEAKSRGEKTTATPGPPAESNDEAVVDATVQEEAADEPAKPQATGEIPDEAQIFKGTVKNFRLHSKLAITGDEETVAAFKTFGYNKDWILVSLSDVVTSMSPVILTEGQEVEFKLRKDGYGLYGTELTLEDGAEVIYEGEKEERQVKFPREDYMADKVFTGTVSKFLQKQGTGFISFDEDSEFVAPGTLKPQFKKRWEKNKELWFHRNDLVSEDPAYGVANGTEIEFQVYTDERGMGAKDIKLKGGEPISGWEQDLDLFRAPKQKREKKNKKRKRDDEDGVDVNPASAKKVRMVKRDDGTMEIVEDKKGRRGEWKAGKPNPTTGALRGRVIKYDHISQRGVVEADDTQYIILAWQIYKDKNAGVTDETVRLNNNQRVEFFPGKNSDGEDVALYVMSKTGGPIRTKARADRTRERSPGRGQRGGGRVQYRTGGGRQQRVQYVATMPQCAPRRMGYSNMGGMQTMSAQPMMMAQMGGRQQLVYAVPQQQQQQGNFTYVSSNRRQSGGRQGGGGGGFSGRSGGGRRRNRGGVY